MEAGVAGGAGGVCVFFCWRQCGELDPQVGDAPLGAGLVAADGGVVISAGTISGYGKTIIIEHNATYSTLYAHSSELLVSEGQVVKKGQLIARVGDTGYTTGPNLHFEVRVNGSPVDPSEYI